MGHHTDNARVKLTRLSSFGNILVGGDGLLFNILRRARALGLRKWNDTSRVNELLIDSGLFLVGGIGKVYSNLLAEILRNFLQS